MKIYTKTGDKGTTSLLGGTRLSKAHIRIDTYGTVDELNTMVGLVRDQPVNRVRSKTLIEIQERLFTIGSSLAAEPGKAFSIPDLLESDIDLLEEEMDRMDQQLPEMRNFVLPGGHQSVSFCHMARVTCRKAERLCIALAQKEEVSSLIIQYLNRLSDYFFVLSRMMAQELQAEEIPWLPRKSN